MCLQLLPHGVEPDVPPPRCTSARACSTRRRRARSGAGRRTARGAAALASTTCVPSALLTAMTSASSRTPFLIPCRLSPARASVSSRNVSTMSATCTSDWPTPTVSTNTTSNPAASTTMIDSRVARVTPPSTPALGDGRMNARSSTASRDMRVLSPRMLPPGARGRRVDGEHGDAVAARRQLAAEGVDERRLPGAGNAGDADAVAAAGTPEQADEQLLGRLLVIRPGRLDERDRPAERRPVGRQDAGLVASSRRSRSAGVAARRAARRRRRR